MARRLRIAALVVGVLVAAVALYGYRSTERLSAPEFEEALDRFGNIHFYTPIGVTGKRAYIEHWSLVRLLGERIVIQWTPTDELSTEILARVTERR